MVVWHTTLLVRLEQSDDRMVGCFSLRHLFCLLLSQASGELGDDPQCRYLTTIKRAVPTNISFVNGKCPWGAVSLPGPAHWCRLGFHGRLCNHGTGRAAKFLQKAVMVNQDGAIGPLTLMAVGEANLEEIINRLAVYRDAFYRSLSTFETFGRGWIRRNDETREQALEMARG